MKIELTGHRPKWLPKHLQEFRAIVSFSWPFKSSYVFTFYGRDCRKDRSKPFESFSYWTPRQVI